MLCSACLWMNDGYLRIWDHSAGRIHDESPQLPRQQWLRDASTEPTASDTTALSCPDAYLESSPCEIHALDHGRSQQIGREGVAPEIFDFVLLWQKHFP